MSEEGTVAEPLLSTDVKCCRKASRWRSTSVLLGNVVAPRKDVGGTGRSCRCPRRFWRLKPGSLKVQAASAWCFKNCVLDYFLKVLISLSKK